MPILSVLIIALAILLCIPATRAFLAIFFIDHFPTTTTILVIIAAVVLLPTAVIWSIYGPPTLIVLLLLATFSIWSSVARWLTTTILIVGLLAVFFFPPVKSFIIANYPSSKDWISDNRAYVDLKIKEGSLAMKDAIRDSRVTIGTLGHILEDGVGYDEFGMEIPRLVIHKNDSIKSMGKIKSQETTGDEGLIQIMLPNKHGNFVGGMLIWVPIRNASWKQVKKEMDTPPPPAPTQQPPTSTPNSQRLNGQIVGADLFIDGNQYTGKLTLTGDLFAFNGRDRNGNNLSLAGARDENSIWMGSWNKNKETPKSFILHFAKTNNFSGEVYKYTEDGKEMKFTVKAITSTITSAR